MMNNRIHLFQPRTGNLPDFCLASAVADLDHRTISWTIHGTPPEGVQATYRLTNVNGTENIVVQVTDSVVDQFSYFEHGEKMCATDDVRVFGEEITAPIPAEAVSIFDKPLTADLKIDGKPINEIKQAVFNPNQDTK